MLLYTCGCACCTDIMYELIYPTNLPFFPIPLPKKDNPRPIPYSYAAQNIGYSYQDFTTMWYVTRGGTFYAVTSMVFENGHTSTILDST